MNYGEEWPKIEKLQLEGLSRITNIFRNATNSGILCLGEDGLKVRVFVGVN